ncbi:hypothetical protein TNCV_1653211 [Trichonephila clavipes]|nr:hypothetical protein TNCV_1653211 [Trichonephila clavipes]
MTESRIRQILNKNVLKDSHYFQSYDQLSRPSGIVVSDADCCAVGTGFDSGEDMDFCKCIVPSRHRSTLNSRRAANPLVRLVDGEERLRPTTGVRLAPCHDEFRGPRSDYVRQVALATTTIN